MRGCAEGMQNTGKGHFYNGGKVEFSEMLFVEKK
jgi:hypothetical protein